MFGLRLLDPPIFQGVHEVENLLANEIHEFSENGIPRGGRYREVKLNVRFHKAFASPLEASLHIVYEALEVPKVVVGCPPARKAWLS